VFGGGLSLVANELLELLTFLLLDEGYIAALLHWIFGIFEQSFHLFF
jgi:hypothetical protein